MMSDPGHLQVHPGLDPEAFECVITAVEEDWLTFDRTFFYPMGGGQPADRGRLAGDGIDLNVVDVRGKGGGTHQVEGVEADTLADFCGSEVRADIDVVWRNRLSRMHTAQHLVSAVADELWGGRTVGNQIGFERTRIDIGFQDKDQFDARPLQEKVNELIAGGGAVTMGFSPRAELLDDPLSRPADTLWQYRVKTDQSSDGYGQSQATIWDGEGKAVALSRQTFTVFA